MTHSRKRKRVRFGSEDAGPDSVKVRICERICPSSEMTDEEKGQVWIRDACFRENVQKA
eukprot:CAMPEP_0176145004 /NCGR_PEP_ID=MMETSP0120_2-20121206/73843_1 /TAXON_ID=160619 /ORGANISM="Kryptoperidinium foliaceum, Strain CCMP 1326" /LENGTH=58 /DNA_ID=CAMNT_0017481419 /DNA_START=8 /DNA_END=181 /DNA_ORIENTATION=-